MPANVEKAFERGVSALFGVPRLPRAYASPEKPANVFRVWNKLAIKFPDVYEFATASRKARATEEKLCVLFKLDPAVNEGRSALAAKFETRLEGETASTLEAALDNWWKEASRG